MGLDVMCTFPTMNLVCGISFSQEILQCFPAATWLTTGSLQPIAPHARPSSRSPHSKRSPEIRYSTTQRVSLNTAPPPCECPGPLSSSRFSDNPTLSGRGNQQKFIGGQGCGTHGCAMMLALGACIFTRLVAQVPSATSIFTRTYIDLCPLAVSYPCVSFPLEIPFLPLHQ